MKKERSILRACLVIFSVLMISLPALVCGQPPLGDYGDAPEGVQAYTNPVITGNFPTCFTTGPSDSYIVHLNSVVLLGDDSEGLAPTPWDWDSEPDGRCDQSIPLGTNCGVTFGDEWYKCDPGPCSMSNPKTDPDAGVPRSVISPCDTQATLQNVQICNVTGADITAYFNALFDWNKDGDWRDASTCTSPGDAPEWDIVNYPVGVPPMSCVIVNIPFNNPPYSGLPGPFSDTQDFWMRATVTTDPIDDTGDVYPEWGGEYNTGESEDYFIEAQTAEQGACCYPEPTGGGTTLCIVTTQANCEDPTSYNGIYQGDGTACQGIEACCMPDGTCVDVDSICCDDLGGTPQGQGSVCGGMEACCVQGTCVDADALCCVNELGGTPQGPGTACPGTTIACCLQGDDPDCQTVDQPCCDDIGGTISPIGAPACLGDVDPANGIDDACELEEKWLQPPDLASTGMDVFAQLPPTPGVVLASDFNCTTTGPILEIHVWGSWLHDEYPDGDPGNTSFTLSLHSDIPVDPPSILYSRPGDLLWLREFTQGTFSYQMYAQGLEEDFYFPHTGTYISPGDSFCWEYIFRLEPDEFLQGGTELEPIVYWLDVQATPGDESYFGWKTTPLPEQWNDDSVWGNTYSDPPPPSAWSELFYPTGHLWAGASLDLAFAIYGGEEVPGLCYEYWNKYQCCLGLEAAGSELDYDTCKDVCKNSGSTQGECEGNGCFWDAPKSKCRAALGPCEAAGCTFNKNSPTQAYPCMLDICLMEVDGDGIVGGTEAAICAREAGRGGCPTPAEDDLCLRYFKKYQTCLGLMAAGSELDYDTCKEVCKDSGSTQGECEGNGCFWDAPKSRCRAEVGPCEAAGCTFNKNSPTQAYPCMLDICLMGVDDGDHIVGGTEAAICAREAGRGGCPCNP